MDLAGNRTLRAGYVLDCRGYIWNFLRLEIQSLMLREKNAFSSMWQIERHLSSLTFADPEVFIIAFVIATLPGVRKLTATGSPRREGEKKRRGGHVSCSMRHSDRRIL
jgi:hypothetical protein